MKKWTYQKDPLREYWRLYEGERLVGAVTVEADAKRICDLFNAVLTAPLAE